MRTLALRCCLLLAVGCGGQIPQPGGSPEARGRFAHAAIHQTSAPWDGAAVRLILAEGPVTTKAPGAPFLWVRINQAASALSGQRITLDAKESRTGEAQWCARPGEGVPLRSTEVRFETFREGEPVRGRYDVILPDGTRHRGTFEATWLAPDGPGG